MRHDNKTKKQQIQKWNKINFKNKICQLQFSTEK